MSKHQFDMDFEPGILERYPTFMECIRGCIHESGKPQKMIAADLDMSPGEFGRKIADNSNDPVHFPAKFLPDLIEATGSLLPVYWLNKKFCETPEARQQRLLSRLERTLNELNRLPKLINQVNKAAREGEK